MRQEKPEIELGEKVFNAKTDKENTVCYIHEGKCPKCLYDRIAVTGDRFAGIYQATCQNPECEYQHEV